MVSNFGQFAPGEERATSIDIAQQVLSQPLIAIKELLSPPKDTLMYALGMGLPLLFVPLIAKDAWLMAALPVTGILLAQGSNDPLSINIRYTFLVAPQLFAGSIYWWRTRQSLFHSKRLKSIWNGCIALSLMIAIAANQNRSFSFAIPDSFQPWVYTSPIEQWRHGSTARRVLGIIPSTASVSANTNLVPWLAPAQNARSIPPRHWLSRCESTRDGCGLDRYRSEQLGTLCGCLSSRSQNACQKSPMDRRQLITLPSAGHPRWRRRDVSWRISSRC